MMRKWKDDVLLCLIYLAAFFTEFLLIGILGYVFVKGFPQVSLSFLTNVTSVLQGTAGIAGNFVNTLYMVVMTLAVAVPRCHRVAGYPSNWPGCTDAEELKCKGKAISRYG